MAPNESLPTPADAARGYEQTEAYASLIRGRKPDTVRRFRAILAHLSTAGEASSTELAQLVGWRQNRLAGEMAALVNRGLVKTRPERPSDGTGGRHYVYSLREK